MTFVLADRVRETSTTTGTGTIDLAGPVSGFQGFVAGIGTGNTCYYAIIHRGADEWETGIGTVTDASPDTLARTTVVESSNADALVNFSAGTKDVIVTPLGSRMHTALRETAGPTLLAMGAVADGDSIRRSGSTLVGFKPPRPSSFAPVPGSGMEQWPVAGQIAGVVGTAVAVVADTLYATPFVPPSRGGTLDRIAINVTALVAGNARLGIYEADPLTALPTTLVLDAGTVDTGTTGTKILTINQALDPGKLYYMVVVFSAAPTIRTLSVNSCMVLGNPSSLGAGPFVGWSRAFTYAALPNPFGTTGLGGISAAPVPSIYLRFSA